MNKNITWIGLGRQLVFIALFCLGVTGLRADGPDSQFFDANGVKIHYIRQGAGEPVVLIHGLYASAVMNWQMPGIIAALAKDHDVIALDLPGHGLSDKPDDATAYGMQMVQDVVLLLDHLQIKKAHIVGYSLGGIVALKFIVDNPERVISGTLGGMGWMPEGGMMQRTWENMQPKTFRSTPGICLTSVGQLAVTEAGIKSVKVPMEVLVGDQDPMHELYVMPLQSARPDWPVIQIQGAGHINCITKPQFTNELVKWIEANRQP